MLIFADEKHLPLRSRRRWALARMLSSSDNQSCRRNMFCCLAKDASYLS